MIVIGLCGGSGSGKGTVADLFLNFDIPSVDTDKVYHDLTSYKSPCLDALVDEFGEEILSSNGALDRSKLSQIVFLGENSSGKRQILNQISHKFVLDKKREILKEYRNLGKKAVLVDAPLLFESGFDKECDFVIAVIADEYSRIMRIVNRDNITAEKAKLRIKSQLSDEYLEANSKYVIKNDGNLLDLRSSVEAIAKEILNS